VSRADANITFTLFIKLPSFANKTVAFGIASVWLTKYFSATNAKRAESKAAPAGVAPAV